MLLSLPLEILQEAWRILLDSSVYILFGILIAGLLKVVLNPDVILHHLGRGRYSSVLKAAFFGVPLPLWSCGVLPAAASLQKQGANKGATTAFLISTPESGVDSIAITYALLDPIMTVIRPVAAFISAITAGLLENSISWSEPKSEAKANRSCPVDNCCDGEDCSEEEHKNHHTLREKIVAGFRYAVIDVWGDIAIWFYVGLLIAAVITVLIPDELMVSMLGGGFSSMLIMLLIGVPLYICATASTPVAAALILKGVSPGAALVFLLVGPATNVTSLSVLFGILGRKSTFRYLAVLATTAVFFGLTVDQVYSSLGISPQAIIGEAAEIIPEPIKLFAVLILAAFSIKPLAAWFKKLINRKKPQTYLVATFPDLRSGTVHSINPTASHAESGGCGCEQHGSPK